MASDHGHEGHDHSHCDSERPGVSAPKKKKSHGHSHGHHHHHHHHSHEAALGSNDPDAVKRIRFAFLLNLIFALIELVGGLITGSFAIVADAIHDFGDSFSLGLALYLQKKSQGGPSQKLSYGYLRYSVVSALISGIVIVAGSAVILIEAIQHFFEPRELPNIAGMIGLAVLGISVNAIAAWRMGRGSSHNEKILTWHLLEDLLGWIVVLVGAIAMALFDLPWIDPVLAIGISIFIAYNVIRNLREPFRIILQYVPGEEDTTVLRQDIASVDGVCRVEELHAWSLDGQQHVLTTRLVIRQGAAADAVREKVRQSLQARGFRFVTIEVDVEAEGTALPGVPPC